MPTDDQRLAAASRVLRRRQRLTQESLAVVGLSPHLQRQIEAARAGRLPLEDLRDHFSRLGASVRVTVWYDGATLDRLLDEDHAAVIESGIRMLDRYSWKPATEVTFSEWGERGSIDLFGSRETERAVFIGEAKSAWGSLEETLRSLDVKIRLAPTIAQERLGWRPRTIGAAIIFPEDATARRIAQRHSATLGVSYPDRNRAIRRWLQAPSGPLRGLWFLSNPKPS